jgi:hypothetical protein
MRRWQSSLVNLNYCFRQSSHPIELPPESTESLVAFVCTPQTM